MRIKLLNPRTCTSLRCPLRCCDALSAALVCYTVALSAALLCNCAWRRTRAIASDDDGGGCGGTDAGMVVKLYIYEEGCYGLRREEI